MNKLTLNDNVRTFLDGENKEVWNLIIENKIEELLLVFPREEAEAAILDKIMIELFSTGKSEALETYNLSIIKQNNGSLIRNLIRLVFALDINGNYESLRLQVVDRLFESIPSVVDIIQEEGRGYPARKVHEVLISEAVDLRNSLQSLSYYYTQKDDADALHFAVVMRLKISLTIMGNYKNVIGHDMIEAAKAKEKIGEREAALGFYNAARENLKNELHWFIESPEMGPNEEDRVMLQSLQEAYLSIDRLNATSTYTEACAVIDEILSREYVEFDFDEEDDGEE